MSTCRALIYVRISEDREGAGLGVARQLEDCEVLAERLGWQVVGVHCDNDVSASTGKPRDGYRAMLGELTAGMATGVLAWHTDRLHRSPVELEDYVKVCEDHGVVTHTVKAGPVDLASPSGRLVARQLGAVARYEVEHAAERQRAKRLQKARAGEYLGGRRPFGYESDGVTIREAEAAEIRRCTKAVLSGVSLRSLATGLNDRGVATSTGSTWNALSLRDVLIRERNAGLMRYQGEVIHRDGEPVQAEWDAIVPEDTWRGVRAVLTDRSRRTSPLTTGRRWLGSGLYRCGVCGDGTTCHVTRNSGRGARPDYVCSKVKHVSRSVESVDDYVIGTVLARLRRPDVADLLAPPAPDTSALHVEATALRERLTELSRLFADGMVDASQLAEGSTAIRGKLSAVEGRIADANSGTVLGEFAGRDPADVWADLDLDRRRAVVDTLVAVTILVSPKGRPAGWQPGMSYFRPESVEIDWRRS